MQGLSKVFRIWKRPADMLVETITGRQKHTEFAALRNVSFDVKPGSIVGILGRNGAGKSTLLRIIAGTLDATEGSVAVNGRVAAILELGTGFHPEYSGRENIYLGGLCLGLSRAEIKAKFDEIVAFAELEDFIEQPFRTYSSGMQARLTFAVATSVDPDILIVDEALSVGDARFALKSFDRIRQFAARNKSILFVSHDINQVMTFCDEAIMLEHGEVFAQGDPREVGNIYHQRLFGESCVLSAAKNIVQQVPVSEPDTGPKIVGETALSAADELQPVESANSEGASPEEQDLLLCSTEDAAAPAEVSNREHRYGDQKAVIESFRLRDERGGSVVQLESLQPYECAVTISALEDVERLTLGILIRNQRGVDVYGADSLQVERSVFVSLRAGERVEAIAAFSNKLAPGHYFATLSLARDDGHKHDLRSDVLEFVVAAKKGVYSNSLANLDAHFRFEKLASVPAI